MHTKTPQMTRSSEAAGMWSRGLVLVILLGLWQPCLAADFACPAGDVACLIDAINRANTNGQANTITLEAGTYPLTAVHNPDGQTGLPSVTGTLTITGAVAETTSIER